MNDTLYRLLKAIEEADRAVNNGFDALASASWDEIRQLAGRLREEMGRLDQEDDAMTTDPKTIARLRELEKKATQAPWPLGYVQGAVRHVVKNLDADCFWFKEPSDPDFNGWNRYEDGPFIAELRNHAASLLADADRVQELEREIAAALDALPAPAVIRVREGGGPENVAASLAVSCQNIRALYYDALHVVVNLRTKLAEAGVEGSPPPTGDTTIGAWMKRAREAERKLALAVEGLEKIVSSQPSGAFDYEPRSFGIARSTLDKIKESK